MRKIGGSFIELCVGVATVLLIVAAFIYIVTLPAPATEEKPAIDKELGERYEALKLEKSYLEGYMELLDEEKDGMKWMAHKEPTSDDKIFGFSAYVSQSPLKTSGRVVVEFERSADVTVERMTLITDGTGQEISLEDARREISTPKEGRVNEMVEFSIDENIAILKRLSKGENVVLRISGKEGDAKEAMITAAQIRNFGRTLRLYEVYKEMRAIEETRREA